MKKLTCLFAYFCWVASAFAQSPNAFFPFTNAEGKWGYVDAQKNVKIAYQFLGASPFYEERAFVARKVPNQTEHVVSVIDLAGKVLFDVSVVGQQPHELCQMDYYRYSDGLLSMPSYDENTPSTYLDKAGKVKITLKKGVFGSASFSEGLAYAQTSDSTAMYIDITGKKVLDVKASMAVDNDFKGGWVVTSSGIGSGDFSYLNKKGEKAPFLKNFKHIEDLAAMSEGIAFLALPNPSTDNYEPILKLLKSDGSTIPIKIKLRNSTPVTTVTGYRFSEGLALVHIPDEQASNKKIYLNRQVYLNKQGEIAFELPAILKGREGRDGDGQVYITSGAGKNFYQGLACWIVQTSDSTVKIVYLTPAGKVAFESGEIKI